MYAGHLLYVCRSDIFELFDLIMLMSQGNMVYFGQAVQMVDHFTRLGFPCPELTNPCDFYGNSWNAFAFFVLMHEKESIYDLTAAAAANTHPSAAGTV